MRITHASVRLSSSALMLTLMVGCGDNLTTLYPDAGVVGSGNATSLGSSSSSGAPSANGIPDSIDASSPTSTAEFTSLPCVVDADCISDDSCRDAAQCVFGLCVFGQTRCNDGNPCTSDACTPGTGACVFQPVAEGSVCQDDNRCDGQVCSGGVCTVGLPRECYEDGNPCTVEACSPDTGECVRTILASGTPCPDNDPCNGTEVCGDGFCRAGTALVCNDDNPCTVDLCTPSLGCQRVPLPDGTSCADTNLCNGDETCSGGLCLPSASQGCFDGNPCTSDACQPETGGCVFTALPNATSCQDGNLCDGQICLNGSCVPGRPVTCLEDNDGNVCTRSACNPATGTCIASTLPDGTVCSDTNVCDGTESCRAGQCTGRGQPMVCSDDGNPCTIEACDPAWGCVRSNVTEGTSCADSNACNGTELCFGGRCSVGVQLRCDDGNACTLDTCIPTIGCFSIAAPDGAPCSDTNVCNGSETCLSTRCVSSQSSPSCPDDRNPCTRDVCDPSWGCMHIGVPNGTSCADANLCNGAEACSSGVCLTGTAVVCGAPTACSPSLGICQ